jgi:hypothetical protein
MVTHHGRSQVELALAQGLGVFGIAHSREQIGRKHLPEGVEGEGATTLAFGLNLT